MDDMVIINYESIHKKQWCFCVSCFEIFSRQIYISNGDNIRSDISYSIHISTSVYEMSAFKDLKNIISV